MFKGLHLLPRHFMKNAVRRVKFADARVVFFVARFAIIGWLAMTAVSADVVNFPGQQAACLACHGENGRSDTPDTPSLGGMPEFYTLLQLVAFRDKIRSSDIMQAVVTDFTDDDLRAAAAFVSEQPMYSGPPQDGDAARLGRGRELVENNRCNVCHGADLLGGNQMPPLRYQREDYLLKALDDYKAERRLGDRAAMVEVVTALSEGDMQDIAYYLANYPD